MTFPEALELIAKLQRQIEDLVRENRLLKERIEELERAAARPAAPFRRDESKKIPPEQQKRPGRKPGHPGAHRPVPPKIDDEHEEKLPPECPECHGTLENPKPLVQYIEEIPPIQPRVTRLTTWSAKCKCCGKVIRTSHPLQTSLAKGAAGVHLGPRAQALTVLLNKHAGLPMRRTCAVLSKLCGLQITPGGVSQLLDRAADRVALHYDDLITQLRSSPAVNADETSWWVGGPKWWLWVFTNARIVLFCVEQRRNADVVHRTLGDYKGMLVSDCLNTYDSPPYRKHKCIAHHLRAIQKALERPDTKDTKYLDSWRKFFRSVMQWYRLRSGTPPEMFEMARRNLENLCDELLAQPSEQTGDVAVRNRLAKQRPHLLGCLYEPAAEPTNNRAEQALRPAVIARKLSCGNRTVRGKRTFEILASLGATFHQRREDFLAWLTRQLVLPMPAG